MTSKQAFKEAFLEKMAECGILPSDFEKASGLGDIAAGAVTGTGGMLRGGVSNVAEDVYNTGRTTAAVAPFAVPGLASYMLASLDNTTKKDLQALQETDLILAYRRAAAEIRRRRAAQQEKEVHSV